jgi:hypothetical protein
VIQTLKNDDTSQISQQADSLLTGSQKTSHRQKCLNSYIPNADRLANKRTHPSKIAAAVLQEHRKKKKVKRMTEKTREKKEKLNSRISVSISCL